MKIQVRKPSQLTHIKNELVGFDIETGGLEINRNVCLISIFVNSTKECYVIPVNTKEYALESEEIEILKEIIPTLKVVGHNLQFDMAFIKYHWGVIPQVAFDTFILARMLQYEKQSLKDIFTLYYPNHSVVKFNQVLDIPTDGSDIKYSLKDKETIRYSGLDAFMPLAILQEMVKDERYPIIKNVYRIENKMVEILSKMKANGIVFDREDLDKRVETLNKNYSDNLMAFYEEVGRRVKLNSSKDLAELLYDEMGLECKVFTGKGARSTNSSALEYHKSNPVVKRIMELKSEDNVARSTAKLHENFLDNKLHSSWESVGYDGTGRLYSKPSVTSIAKEGRKSVKPAEGNKFVYFDLSSAELYILLYWAGCKELTDLYDKKEDLHTYVASKLLGREIDRSEREISKVVSFATVYGSTGGSVAEALHITYDEGKDLVDKYFQMFPQLKEKINDLQQFATRTGYTKTMLGRTRVLPNIYSYRSQEVEKSLRQAVNSAIQSSCADFIKLIMCRLDEKGYKIVASVFDSVLLEVPNDQDMDVLISDIDKAVDMSEIFYGMKFNFEWSEGNTWYDAQYGK